MMLKAPKSRQTTFKTIGSCNCGRKFASLFLLVTSSVCAAVDYSSFSFSVKTKDHFSVCEFYCWMPISRIALRIEANTDFNFLGHRLCICAAAAKLLQSSLTLCDPIDGSPPGSPVPGILKARTLEWVAISSSNAWKWKVKVKSLSRVRPSATPWTAAFQVPPSMGFSRQEYWSRVPFPSLHIDHCCC